MNKIWQDLRMLLALLALRLAVWIAPNTPTGIAMVQAITAFAQRHYADE